MDAAAESVGEVEGLAVCVPEPLPERLGVPLAVAVGLGDGGTQAQAPVLSVMRGAAQGAQVVDPEAFAKVLRGQGVQASARVVLLKVPFAQRTCTPKGQALPAGQETQVKPQVVLP